MVPANAPVPAKYLHIRMHSPTAGDLCSVQTASGLLLMLSVAK